MVKSTKHKQVPVVIIPNLNGGDDLLAALQSLHKQTCKPYIIVVDNASTDGSTNKAKEQYPEIEVITHSVNKGYAGGVNPGFKRAIELEATYAAPFNDDAIADPRWLERLVNHLDAHPEAGAAAAKVLKADGKHMDSTGDQLTHWGLAYPRGRDEPTSDKYDNQTDIFAASGAASLYRVTALKEVGLLDEDFFAYYEDVDLSFRLQLAGWKVQYVPTSVVYHQIGTTSSKIKGFTTLQTSKNLPLLVFKNMPDKYLLRVMLRLNLARMLFTLRALTRGQIIPALKGGMQASKLMIQKRHERELIQRNKKVSDEYIWSIITHDLPPNASALRKLRSLYWKITRRHS